MTETELQEKIEQSLDNKKILMLYNDDVNSFDHVILCLMEYCHHTLVQAEQCALLVHHNGKCDIKRGSFDDVLPIYNALLNNKLNVNIENL